MRTILGMPPDFPDILLRLGLALFAGALLGIDRTARGRPAGMRTTMLVCLAAALAMILGTMLLDERGDTPRFDPLRLAQGILAGMGFIGAGAIVRRDEIVLGVTTAATLWYATVLGLCIGAGAWKIALIGLGLGILILWVLHYLEDLLHSERRARLTLTLALDGPSDERLRGLFARSGCSVVSWGIEMDRDAQARRVNCTLTWRARRDDQHVPECVQELTGTPGVTRMSWEPILR